MKKEMIGIVIAGLIGTCPLSTYAANDNSYIQLGKSVSIISVDRKQDHDQKREKGKEKEEERREQEHREQGRRDQERRDQERREQDRRDQERKKEEERRLELERREQERRKQEHREDDRWGRDHGNGHGPGHQDERWEHEHREDHRREQERNDAGYIIHRTADVIFVAQRATGRRHYYKGLSLAVAHQQKARQLYMAGFYQDAIFHSLRAREIAIVIIRENREYWSGSWDDREERYRCNGPRDNDLDIKLNLIKIGDKEAVRISIDLDL